MGLEKVPEENRYHLSLSFYDFDGEPQRITKLLGLDPDSVGLKGECYTSGNLEKILDYSYWGYKWRVDTNEYVGTFIQSFIEQIIAPRLDAIASLAKESTVQFQIVQYYFDGFNPGLNIDAEYIQVLSRIGASLDVDIYCLSDTKE